MKNLHILRVNRYEGSIPFTRSTDYQGFSKQCSKSAVNPPSELESRQTLLSVPKLAILIWSR